MAPAASASIITGLHVGSRGAVVCWHQCCRPLLHRRAPSAVGTTATQAFALTLPLHGEIANLHGWGNNVAPALEWGGGEGECCHACPPGGTPLPDHAFPALPWPLPSPTQPLPCSSERTCRLNRRLCLTHRRRLGVSLPGGLQRLV